MLNYMMQDVEINKNALAEAMGSLPIENNLMEIVKNTLSEIFDENAMVYNHLSQMYSDEIIELYVYKCIENNDELDADAKMSLAEDKDFVGYNLIVLNVLF